MYIASAYPNSVLSALTMMVIGLVMAGSLAAWLGLVFLADRQPRKARGDAALRRRTTQRKTSTGTRKEAGLPDEPHSG